MTVAELKIGESGVVTSVLPSALSGKALTMGLVPGTEVELVAVAPLGDPIIIKLRGFKLGLRLDEASTIEIDKKNS